MSVTDKEFEYCQIEFKMRYKGEDPGRAGGLRTMWLLFQARVTGPDNNYLAGESSEIPIAANVAGASFVPQKEMSGHVNVHQNLLRKLENDGWELLPFQGNAWWERRLRRPPRFKHSLAERLMAKLGS